MSKSIPSVICLTPVKNEAWIIERFLKCTSLWADHIIIADQCSDDRTVEIARKFQKVTLISNENQDLDEVQRQHLLIDAARKFPEPRILIALDADEFLTPNFMDSPEWKTVLSSPKGTVIQFLWANIKPDMSSYWTPPLDQPFGFHDDGSTHRGKTIHSSRIPVPEMAPVLRLRDIKVMHYQYTDWERMKSKHRWYQCWERIHDPLRSAVDIYRQYHHMDVVPEALLQPLPTEWLRGYEAHGIDMTSVYRDRPYWWDKEVLAILRQYGARLFAREDIWSIDWQQIETDIGIQTKKAASLGDPRKVILRRFHKWLRWSQKFKDTFPMPLLDKVLSRFL